MKLPTKLFSCLFSIILALSFVSSGKAQQRYRFLPLDEAEKDASFFTFRKRLIAAVKKRDVEFLLGALAPDVQINFGGDVGIAEFKKVWKLEQPNSELWPELLTVLTNGGTFILSETRTVNFCAPYIYSAFPAALDAFENQVIFGDNVNLRARPSAKAALIAKLSYDVVKVNYENSVRRSGRADDYEWLEVETLDGKKGFVSARFVRSPLDYRACFEKRRGKWKMIFFLAGD